MSSDLAKLVRNAHNTSHDEILKAANASLKASKTDVLAQHVRVVALLKLDRYEDVVRAFESGGDKLKEAAKLEHAYALYKTGNLREAVEVARKSGERGLAHVAAQSDYKLEEFERAAILYRQLSVDGVEENDLRINRSAIDAHLEWKGLGHLVANRKPQRDDSEAFERAFNAACACIARGELKHAEILLNVSKQLCLAAEDLSDEDQKEELLPIMVQQMYVLVQQGKTEEAKKICQSFPVAEQADALTKYIALNNILTVTPHENPFVTQHVYKSVPEPTGGDAPFTHQAVTLTQNSYTVDILAHKYPGVKSATKKRIRSAPEASSEPKIATLSVLNAAATVRNTAGNQAIKTLLSLLEKRPSDIGLLLTIIQLYVLANNLDSATELLERFFERLDSAEKEHNAAVKYTPGLVGAAVELYNAQGRRSSAKTLLVNAANYWKSHPSTASGAASNLLLRAAGTGIVLDPAVTKRDAESAVSIFEDLHKANGKDAVAAAGLVAARYLTDPQASVDGSLVKQLTPVSKLIAGINVSELESAGIFSRQTSLPAARKRKRAAVEEKKDESVPAKKRKLSKKRMPEDYEEGKKMDPERWLPLRERSYWRPKGKKGKARAAGLTQGGVVDEKVEKGVSPGVATASGAGKAKKPKKKVKK